VAPSHAFNPDLLAEGLALARAAGHNLHVPADLLRPHRYFASDDDHRLAQLTDALTSDRYAAVWAVRGGSGLTRLLPRIPWAQVRRRPVIGFSDLTPLLEATVRAAGGVAVHGPVLHSLPATDPADREALWRLLDGRPLAPLQGAAWSAGRASGKIIGGNLTLLAATCGTPWQPRAAGKVLLIEEIGEPPYRVDRALQQLRSAGVFRGVRAILLGTFTGCEAPADAGWTVDDVLREQLLPLGVPVLAGLPVGHGRRNHPVPIGAFAHVDGDQVRFSLSARPATPR
jgi:muramoyltetrapeptide carboxypeptidase